MNDIDRIKELLFGNEKKALDAITRRLETPESRAADVADVLPDSLLRSHSRDTRLIKALEQPVEACIRESIRKDPDDFAAALFPVIGPAIRKSIAESLRSMVESLNQAIENSLSVKMRYRSWRAGVSIGQYILQESIIYRVEQVYLIRRQNGLLIAHLHHPDAGSKDSDAVSAMFTAIQDFIRDSFAQGAGDALDTAEMGEFTLWGIHGPHAMLVCVTRGVPPAGLRADLNAILERVHLRYGEALADYTGEPGQVAGIEIELEPALLLEQRHGAAGTADDGGSGLPFPVLIILLLLGLAVAWFFYDSYRDARTLERVRTAFLSEAGIVPTEIAWVDGRVAVRGLRDPLARPVDDVLAAAGLAPEKADVLLAPYQALDPTLVQARVERILQPPAEASLRIVDGVLTVTGSASPEWKQGLRATAAALPGVDAVDLSGMTLSDQELAALATAAIDPPDSVRLDVRDGRASIGGTASVAWIGAARQRLASLSGLTGVDTTGLEPGEQRAATRLAAELDGSEVYFGRNEAFRAGQEPVLADLATRLTELGQLAALVGMRPAIVVRGYSDASGTTEQNRLVETKRAEAVRQSLVARGVEAHWIEARPSGRAISGGGEDLLQRRAAIRVRLRLPEDEPQ